LNRFPGLADGAPPPRPGAPPPTKPRPGPGGRGFGASAPLDSQRPPGSRLLPGGDLVARPGPGRYDPGAPGARSNAWADGRPLLARGPGDRFAAPGGHVGGRAADRDHPAPGDTWPDPSWGDPPAPDTIEGRTAAAARAASRAAGFGATGPRFRTGAPPGADPPAGGVGAQGPGPAAYDLDRGDAERRRREAARATAEFRRPSRPPPPRAPPPGPGQYPLRDEWTTGRAAPKPNRGPRGGPSAWEARGGVFSSARRPDADGPFARRGAAFEPGPGAHSDGLLSGPLAIATSLSCLANGKRNAHGLAARAAHLGGAARFPMAGVVTPSPGPGAYSHVADNGRGSMVTKTFNVTATGEGVVARR